MPYTFDVETGEYKDTSTGEVIAVAAILAILQSTVDETLSPEAATIAGLFVGGSLSVVDWEKQAQELVTTAFMWYLWAAIGGADAASDGQYDMLELLLETQMSFLAGFALALGDGNMSQELIASRLRLYFASAKQAYTRGRMDVMGCPDPDVHPGDCSTDCCVHCDCGWRIERLYGAGNYNLFWELGTVEKHCKHCIERAKIWKPLRVRNGVFIDTINRNDSRLFRERSRRDANGLPFHPDVLLLELLKRESA